MTIKRVDLLNTLNLCLWEIIITVFIQYYLHDSLTFTQETFLQQLKWKYIFYYIIFILGLNDTAPTTKTTDSGEAQPTATNLDSLQDLFGTAAAQAEVSVNTY